MPKSLTNMRPGNGPDGTTMLACVERALLARHAATSSSAIPEGTIGALTDAALLSDEALAQPLAKARLRHALTAEGVMLKLLAPVSRKLGDRWNADTLDFCDVTLGVIRLRRALRRLLVETPDAPIDPTQRRIALWTVPGDQHRFGTAMLAAIFSRRGWAVIDTPIDRPDDIARQLRVRPCGVVGLSIGNERLLSGLMACADAVRLAGARLMVGGSLLEMRPDLAAVVGADAAVGEATEAVTEADRLLHLRRPAAGTPPVIQPRVAAGWIG